MEIINNDRCEDVAKVVYITILVIEKLVYDNKTANHGLPIIIKVGETSGKLSTQLKKLKADYGASQVYVLGVIHKPPEGTRDCERKLKKFLKDEQHKLNIGIVKKTHLNR